jgi:hypothetical protein
MKKVDYLWENIERDLGLCYPILVSVLVDSTAEVTDSKLFPELRDEINVFADG